MGVVAALAVASVPAQAASPPKGSIMFSWKDCGAKNGSHSKINSIHIDPPVPKVGDNITITSNVTLDKKTTDIKCDLAMASKYHRSVDLCSGGTAKAPLSISTVIFPKGTCPKEPSTFESSRYMSFRKKPPSGANPTSVLTCTDQDGELFSCAETTFEFVRDAQDHHALVDDIVVV